MIMTSGAKKTVYLEHSAVVDESGWEHLMALLGPGRSARAVVSDWNLIEIASDQDRTRATRRAKLLDSLQPLWMVEYLVVQRQEVRNFVFERFFGAGGEAPEVLTPHLSVMLSHHLGKHTPIGTTAEEHVLRLNQDRKSLDQFDAEKGKIVQALLTLQRHTPSVKRSREDEVFLATIRGRIPDRAPDGRPLTVVEKDRLADFCLQHREEFFRECPAMTVEDALYQVRSRDPARVPKVQDAIDYLHSVMGLSYCDYFLTRDGHLAQMAQQAAKLLSGGSVARVCRTVKALASELGVDLA
jgi:hypothetical protein